MTTSKQNIKSHLLRSLMVVVMMVWGVGESWGQTNYVFYNATYGYLNNDGTTNVALSTTFSPSCVWVANGGLGNTLRNIYSYTDNTKYMRGSTNGSFTLGTSANSWRGANNYLQYRSSGNNYYVKYNGTSFVLNETNNSGYRFIYYTVTIDSPVSESLTSPSISGGSLTISAVGSTTFEHSNSSYQIGYTNYKFNNANHYYATDGTVSNTVPSTTTEGITYTWSLSGIDSYYAEVNSTTGVVTYKHFVGSDVTATLTCTATKDGTTVSNSSTTQITFKPSPYYLYNEEKGVFLSRGSTWGTKCVCDNIGIPYYVNITGNAATLIAYDWGGTSGLGDNLYTDNGSPCAWTFAGNDTNGYTLYNQTAGGYLLATDAHTDLAVTTAATNASKWKLIDKEQYATIRVTKNAATISDVATAAGVGNLITDVVNNTNKYEEVDCTSSIQSASLIGSNTGWTGTANANRDFNVTTNENGTEVYQGSGKLSQTVTGLSKGVYKVTAQGFYRDGDSTNDWEYYQNGYPISLMYLLANGRELRFPAKAEEAESSDNPANNMAGYKTAADAGKYKIELYTYVGDNGNLDLSINVPNYIGAGWAIFSNVTLTYYKEKKLPTTLTFAETAPTVASGNTIQLPSVTLKSGDTTLTGKTITYSATGCSVNQNGVVSNITMTGTSATVTARFAGDDTYAASEATYTFTITAHEAVNETTTSDITITPAEATLDLGGTQDYEVPASISTVTRTRDAYSELTFPVGKLYKKSDNSLTATEPTVTESTGATINFSSVNWSYGSGRGYYYDVSVDYSATSRVTKLTRSDVKTAADIENDITASVVYGSVTKTATAKVIIPASYADITAIYPNPTNITVGVGETANIVYTTGQTESGKPYVNLTYTGYNTNIISVDENGVITGKAEGTTTVTIQSIKLDGTDGVSATVNVEVSNGNGDWNNPYRISSVAGLAKMNDNDKKGKAFLVTADIDASDFDTEITGFTGTLDGNFKKISGLKQALFNTITGGTVKNVILDNVSITREGDVGAIANQASGSSKIYNCGVLSTDGTSSITCTQSNSSAGGIVGYAYGNSRIINCYNYVNVAATTNAGGIVGYVSNASSNTNVQTMVMNCMFYGDITQGTTIAPIYGGDIISNAGSTGLNNYNYFRYESPYCVNGNINKYNCALAAEERYLTRFEFYRLQLNSNKELAAWYATGSTANGAEMAKWVLDKSIAPYPILKPQGKYPSIINIDAAHATTQTERNKGGKLGSLSVSISQGTNAPTGASITTSSLTLNITDKDEDNYNYNYRKVQLPYYNEVGTGNYTNNKVVTGWKVSVSGGSNSFSTGTDAPAYNFADPKCTGKDDYNTSGRVFAQGAYFNVPDSVTSISIQPYWGNAVYLSDPYYDLVYSTSYDATNVEAMGTRYSNGSNYTINGSSQKVYTSLSNAFGAISSSSSVYDYAIVLVGNYHLYCGGTSAFDKDRPVTIMSADLDMDNEPDYSFIYQHTDRHTCNAIRFDFLNWPGIGMIQKVNATTQMPNQGIFYPAGWFEITNTCVVRFTEFEYDHGSKSDAPLILLGGIFEQFTSTQNGNPIHTTYIHVGDNAWFKEFQNGTHADGTNQTPHNPISVTGGEYEKFYLSGTFKPDASSNVKDDNAECYINGGKFGELAGAGQEKIYGDVTFLIDNADIDEFYGGGINENNPVGGNIKTAINNSYVTKFCGGPKFGNMATGKTVSTTANGTTFGTYYGAGNGGTSYYRDRPQNEWASADYGWNTWANGFVRGKYDTDSTHNPSWGIMANYEYEYFAWAGGSSTGNVGRFYINYASLSFAQTNNVTSTLTECTVLNDFYGGGNLGKVSGSAISVLNNCTVNGNAFAAGYSASIPTVKVFNQSAFLTEPSYNGNVGVYNQGVYPDYTEYTWSNNGSTSNTLTTTDGKNYIYTSKTLTGLGAVSGEAKITIDGGSVGGSVFGGGNESKAENNTFVTVKNKASISQSVFGGGNMAEVGGNTTTQIGVDCGGEAPKPTVSGNVFGGGHMASVNTGAGTLATVNVYESTIGKSVFGGCDISGNVKSASVNVIGATVNGRVFGGGNGLEDGFGQSYGTVSTAPTSGSSQTGDDVYSYTDGEYSGMALPQVLNNAEVTVKGHCQPTIVGTQADSYENSHAVFGGGQGAGTRVRQNVDVTIGSTTQSEVTTIYGITYGGSYSGFVNSSCTNHTKTMIVGYGDNTSVKGDIYGGSYGNYVRGEIDLNVNKTKIGADEDSPAGIYAGNNAAAQPECNASVNYVGDNCNITLYGGGNKAPFYGTTRVTFTTGKVGNIYGGGNNAPVYGNTIVEILGGEVCHDVFGGGNNGGVFVWENSTEHPTPNGENYGGNTLVIVRDDCLKVTDGNFVTDALTGNRAANRDNTTTYFGEADPYASDRQMYVLKPNATTAAGIKRSTIKIGGSVFGGGNNAEVTGKTNVNIGADKQ